jgi:diguanylate cyclase (GGDEF)-like protein
MGGPYFVGALFAVLIAAQAAGFVLLGTGRWGSGLAQSINVLGNLIALACVWIAFRRARGITAIFWFLFGVTLIVWLPPNALQAFDTLLDINTLSDSTWRLLYCLYGAPILMILFLPDTYERAHIKSEIFLDLFQIAIVVALIYSAFFLLPASRMLPGDAFLHSLSVSDVESIVLLVAALIRLQFARAPSAVDLLRRFGVLLLVCTVATCVGNWIDRHHFIAAAAWFNLVWSLNQAAPALIAITWVPVANPVERHQPAKFISYLGTNLTFVAMMVILNVLMDRWKEAFGALLTDIAIATSLIAFTVRLALTQHHQQEEIVQRKAAQEQVTASNRKIGHLLEGARYQTVEITQISELGSLLQACASREDVFRLVPERMRRLFPDASGSISLLTSAKSRVETVASWGVMQTDQIFSPAECWGLRRGSVHVHPPGNSAARCSHFVGDGASLCIPLIANGETIGILAIQDNEFPAAHARPDSDLDPIDKSARRLHLAATVAEHIALAIANLNLRESLRLQAVRDPLTGLYNRRYMQEFLEHELHTARRKHRPVSVMMLDLDHFKRYNDTLGHTAGDRMLASVGELLLRSVRAEDIACRYGGEEFTLILPECSLQQASVRAEAIRDRIAEKSFHQGKTSAPGLTVSIGVAAFDETTDRVDLLLKFADDALYQAKRNGRNRVVQARPSSDLPEQNFTDSEPAAAQSESLLPLNFSPAATHSK